MTGHDMTMWYEYWISDFCDMICHDCVSWFLNIWHFWHDISLWHVYWLSDICGMTWICDKFTEYKSFVTWHDRVTLVLKIRHLYHGMIWMCDMTTLIRHFCNYMTLCHEYWLSDICDMTWLCGVSIEYHIFVTWLNMTVWYEYWISDIFDMTWHGCVNENVIWVMCDKTWLYIMSTEY